MRKPEKPALRVIGVKNIKEGLKKAGLESTFHIKEGGICPVYSIPQLCEWLLRQHEKHPEAVIISSKSSIYLGRIEKAEHNSAMLRYEQDLKEWKAKRKLSLEKQLKALEEE